MTSHTVSDDLAPCLRSISDDLLNSPPLQAMTST